MFQVGLAIEEQLVAVAIAGTPVSRNLMDGRTLEVTRVCTLGHHNAASMLYGAVARAAAALGYQRLITYTIETEPGSSPKGAGFVSEGPVNSQSMSNWGNRPGRMQPTLFGDRRRPQARRHRWVRELNG